MKFRRITALLVGAAIMAASSTAVYAESVPQTPADTQTVTVVQDFGASAAKTWDGKSALKAGEKYVLTKSVTLSKKVEIPKGTTLTLNKGVKLGISAKGSLYIRGTLAMKSGSTLSVSGKLYTYSGSKISDTGAIKLNTNKATVTIGGTLTVNKGGKISGTPKSIKLGKNAKVTIKGTNSCKKLASLLSSSDIEQDKKDISERLNTLMTMIMVDKDYYNAIKESTPAPIFKETEEQFEASKAAMADDPNYAEFKDMTYEDFINEFCGALYGYVLENTGTVKSVKIEVAKLTDCMKTLTDEDKEMFTGCGDITKAYIADIKSAMDTEKTGSVEEELSVKMAYVDGKWYIADSQYLV